MRWLTFPAVASALLLGLLALPAARMPFVDAGRYEQAFAERENRPPARLDLMPPTFSGLRENLRGFDAWFADRYGFRMELIGLQARLYLLAGQSPREDQAILGEDGWLYLGNGHQRVIDKTAGRLLFTEAQLDAYAADLEEKRRFLAERGVRLLVFIAPEKHTVYPEHLPGWARGGTGRTMTGQLAGRLRGGEAGFTDLAEALRAARATTTRPLYYKGDTHWNSLGAYHAYRRIMSAVGESHPQARTLAQPPFREAPAAAGDLARMLAIPGGPDVSYTPVFDAGFGSLSLGGNCSPEGGRKAAKAKGRPGEAPRGKERQRGGGSAAGERSADGRFLVVVPNECKPGQAAVVTGSGVDRAPRLLVLGDSFAVALSPYLNQSFGTVVYTHYTNAKTAGRLKRYVNRHKPDLVILEMVERALKPLEPRRPPGPGTRPG